ncbi:MAG: hypothetical protein AAGA16_16900 [Cyanobacteria bacterium P01_E01_bin.35]
MNGAIYLRPLSDRQIQNYLSSLNRESIWDETIVNKPSILELVSKPLFLNMIVVAYQGRVINSKSELLNAYIYKQINNTDNQGTYPPNKSPSQKQTLHYLTWLARKLEANKETEFLLEKLNSKWLATPKQTMIYNVFCIIPYLILFTPILFYFLGFKIGFFSLFVLLLISSNTRGLFVLLVLLSEIFKKIKNVKVIIHFLLNYGLIEGKKSIPIIESIRIDFNKSYFKEKSTFCFSFLYIF